MYRILISFSVAGRWLVAQAIPIVDIPFGVTYHGITEPSGLESFRNILFGQSTAGEGRFAPPRPILNFRHAIINATEPGPVCPQQMVPVALLPIFSNVTNISEDCLNLRITRPANTTSSSNLPVMVYIYGGAAYMLYSFT
jgi:carboxylesterase type B